MGDLVTGIIIGIFIGAVVGFITAALLSGNKCDECKYDRRDL